MTVTGPQDDEARAAARSISAEMHAGFAPLRNDMPMNLLGRLPSPPISAALQADPRRVTAMDTHARSVKAEFPVRPLNNLSSKSLSQVRSRLKL